mgnify:CR=1 FL=1
MHKKCYTIDKFISAWECDLFIDYFDRNYQRLLEHKVDGLNDDFSGRALCINDVDNQIIHHYMNVIRVRTSMYIKETFNLGFNEFVLPCNTQIVKWNIGQDMDVHTDTSRYTDGFNSKAYSQGDGQKTPYHYRWSSLIYLNDEYEGGETIMDDDLINPEKGKLVVFDSDTLHGVKKVGLMNRYTMPMWFTNLPWWYEG